MLILVFVLEWFYPVIFELTLAGATPDKRAFGLKVVMDNGLPIARRAAPPSCDWRAPPARRSRAISCARRTFFLSCMALPSSAYWSDGTASVSATLPRPRWSCTRRHDGGLVLWRQRADGNPQERSGSA
jgi:hypothetical protein